MAKSAARQAWGKAKEVLSSGRDYQRERDEVVRVRVHVDVSCPRDLALATKEALLPERANVLVEVMGLGLPAGCEPPDAAVVVVGEADAAPLICAYALSDVPVGVVCESPLDLPPLDLADEDALRVRALAASDPATLAPTLGEWLVAEAGHDIALAAGLSCCRAPVVDRLVMRCALKNAAVGAVSLIPGSDFPVMTTSQASLALGIAAAYGQGMSWSRAVEIAGVVAAGLGYRSLARSAAGLVPSVEHIVKAGVAWGGTYLTASVLRLRFELGDTVLEALGLGGDAPADGAAAAPAGPSLAAGVPAPLPAAAPAAGEAAQEGSYLVIGQG